MNGNVSTSPSIARLLEDFKCLVETLVEVDAEIARGGDWAREYRGRLDAQLAEIESRIEGRSCPLAGRLRCARGCREAA